METYLIIGAGILGTSTAYHLAKAGAHVIVIDRRDMGQATDAAAGIICPWLSQRRNQAWYTLAKNGARYYPILIKQLEADSEVDTGYKRIGAICLHTEKEKLDKMEERARKRLADTPEIGKLSRLDSIETKSSFPPLSEEFSSLFVSGAARVSGRALRQSLQNAATKYGATFLLGNAHLLFQDNQVTGVRVNERTFFAKKVIVTAGAWARDLLLPLGIEFLVTFQKAQILHLQLSDTDTGSWPVVMPPNDQYILAFEDGRMVVGATHENETGFDCRVTAGGVHEVLEKGLSVAPGLAESTLLETRVGFRPFTPGFLPVIGPLPGFEGILVANGLGASGLTMGPYLGSELAKLALDQTLEIELAKYDPAGAIQWIHS